MVQQMLRIYSNEGEDITKCAEGAILYFLKKAKQKTPLRESMIII